jgi:formylmethanofuran dehydrogenase subunit E
MAAIGCQIIGLNNPQSTENRKKIMAIVETARCAADGIQSVTGCSIGRRTLRVIDYGIMAATFLNLESKKGVRVSVKTDARLKAKALLPDLADSNQVYIEAYKQLSDNDLFNIEEVIVTIPAWDLPGSPPKHVLCEQCGEEVLVGREVKEGGKILCRRCAHLPLYYSLVK